jgi:hypothetical protein
MKYEKTQKRNSHGLTIDQHVFPARSIARFADPSDNRVAVRRTRVDPKELRLTADVEVFCAMRVWDHGAESGFMKKIEDNYQNVAEQIISVRESLADDQHAVITEFFALWAARAHLKANRPADAPLRGIEGKQRQYTFDDREVVEKNGIGYINNDLTIPARAMASDAIRLWLLDYGKQLRGQRWGVIRSSTLEFIVPDQFGPWPIVPVTPKLCLVVGAPDALASEQSVRVQNQRAMQVKREYVFARSFAHAVIGEPEPT